jgi:hypothetical protein
MESKKKVKFMLNGKYKKSVEVLLSMNLSDAREAIDICKNA